MNAANGGLTLNSYDDPALFETAVQRAIRRGDYDRAFALAIAAESTRLRTTRVQCHAG